MLELEREEVRELPPETVAEVELLGDEPLVPELPPHRRHRPWLEHEVPELEEVLRREEVQTVLPERPELPPVRPHERRQVVEPEQVPQERTPFVT